MGILLTDSEWTKAYLSCPAASSMYDRERAICRAQLKKVYEWGEEVCADRTHHNEDYRFRQACSGCLLALKKEAGIGTPD